MGKPKGSLRKDTDFLVSHGETAPKLHELSLGKVTFDFHLSATWINRIMSKEVPWCIEASF